MVATRRSASEPFRPVPRATRVFIRVRPALEREAADGTFHGCVAVTRDRVYLGTTDRPVLVTPDAELPPDVRCFDGFDGLLPQDATQEDVFASVARDALDGCLRGLNTAILAYGQTSTGKTHTMVGDAARPGLCPRAAESLFAEARERGLQLEVKASYYQIYQDTLTDLLAPKRRVSAAMRLREADDVVLVEGLTESPIDSAADVLDILDRGNERRVTALTDLNASSSRSHAVLTLVVTVWRTDSSATESRLHLVDLAGSERVKDSGVSGDRLKEAQHINRSLFALQGVVHALASGARHVPYRDDMLTRLLKPAFGGNCCTTLLATVSPAQQHAKESEGTLRFASSCRLVQSSVTVNEVKRQRPWAEPTAKVAPRPEHVAIEGGVPWTGVDASPFISHLEITTPWGLVHSLVCEGDASPKGVALLLHGSPSDATTWEWLFPALLHSGYRTVAVDMPGCGQSPGKQLPSRSEFNAKPGGPVDIACFILDHIGAQQAVVVGYDWGGGVALSLGICRPKRASHIIAFHPSYGVNPGEDLARLAVPTLVLWVKQDQFHPLNKWRKLFDMIPVSTRQLEVYNIGARWRAAQSYGHHPTLGPQIQRRIVDFLGNLPAVQQGSLERRLDQVTSTVSGRRVVEARNVVVAEETQGLSAEEVRRLMEVPDPAVSAVEEMKVKMKDGTLQQLYAERVGGGSFLSAKLFSALPVLSFQLVENPETLVTAGFWERAPRGWDWMSRSPRYFPGRHVCVRACVQHRPGLPDYMCYHPEGPERTTHRAILLGCQGSDFVVEVPEVGGGTLRLTVSRVEMLRLNQSHVLAVDSRGAVQLEDGLRMDYSSPLARAKMCEVALALSPIVRDLDFGNGDCETLQLQAIEVVRSCLDIITFQRGLDRGRFSAMCDDAAKFMCRGQGHCHTVTSVMAAALYPFTAVLGLDLKFRGGFSWNAVNASDKASGEVCVVDQPERHQWLEVTLRPSMRSFVVDLWVADRSGAEALRWPVDDCYVRRMYPHGRFSIGQRAALATAADFDLPECGPHKEA